MPAAPLARRALMSAALGLTTCLVWPVQSASAASACATRGTVFVGYVLSGPDSAFTVSGSVMTASNCRAEAELQVRPKPDGTTPAFVLLDSRSGQVDVVPAGLARPGDAVVATFTIQSYDLGGDVSNRTASCTTYVGGSCSV